MILVGQYDSPYVRRVAITLHLYGMPFVRNAISVFGDAAEMARTNPLVRIPSLILDDGETLIDSGAILDHLDEQAGAARALVPREGPARRRVLQLMAVASGTIDKAGAVVYERHFHPPAHVNQEWVARCLGQLGGGLAWLEAQLGQRDFFGPNLTQADITAGVLLGYLKMRLPEALGHNRFPRLERLSAACERMEAFVAARPSTNEVMPQ